MTSAGSLQTCGCHPWGPTDFCRLSLFKCSLSWSFSTEGKFFLAPDFPTGHKGLGFLRLLLPVKTKAKKALTVSGFSRASVSKSNSHSTVITRISFSCCRDLFYCPPRPLLWPNPDGLCLSQPHPCLLRGICLHMPLGSSVPASSFWMLPLGFWV